MVYISPSSPSMLICCPLKVAVNLDASSSICGTA